MSVLFSIYYVYFSKEKDDYVDTHVSVPTKIGKVGENNCYNLIC